MFINMLTCFIIVHQQQRKHLLAANRQVYADSEKMSVELIEDVSLMFYQCSVIIVYWRKILSKLTGPASLFLPYIMLSCIDRNWLLTVVSGHTGSIAPLFHCESICEWRKYGTMPLVIVFCSNHWCTDAEYSVAKRTLIRRFAFRPDGGEGLDGEGTSWSRFIRKNSHGITGCSNSCCCV